MDYLLSRDRSAYLPVTLIHDHQFKVAVRLFEYAVNRSVYGVMAIVGGHDDAENRVVALVVTPEEAALAHLAIGLGADG